MKKQTKKKLSTIQFTGSEKLNKIHISKVYGGTEKAIFIGAGTIELSQVVGGVSVTRSGFYPEQSIVEEGDAELKIEDVIENIKKSPNN
jgi:hypothetical protein